MSDFACWCLVFFFKQKTAYEMRISDWSSDVCSSDLHGVDGVREALQAIDDRDQDIGDAAVLELVHDAHPELCAFGLLDPDPEDFLGPVGQYAECDIYGFVADEAFVADFDSDRIEEHQRVTGIERAPLPLEIGRAHV